MTPLSSLFSKIKAVSSRRARRTNLLQMSEHVASDNLSESDKLRHGSPLRSSHVWIKGGPRHAAWPAATSRRPPPPEENMSGANMCDPSIDLSALFSHSKLN
ncbi:hypothetical protein NL676_033044 [Syzygium grande]|nr:hypothetical protein NL676_033044 [Syzygium grande]